MATNHVKHQFLKALQSIPGYKEKKFLLAVSGGVDSMVLLHLFLQENLNFAVAHCNFKLREEASDKDEQLVRSICQQNKIPVFVKTCPVTEGNIQLEARKLRYDFFKSLREKYPYDFLVTAHHADDQVETFFINLSRGSGLKGLAGIPSEKDIFRPLLELSKDELIQYAIDQKIDWREDESNQSLKYLRNKIRLQIIPLLEKLIPGIKSRILHSMSLLSVSAKWENYFFESEVKKHILKSDDKEIYEIKTNVPLEYNKLLIYYWLKPKGFTDFSAIYMLLTAQTGKEVYSSSYRLLKQENQLILYPRNDKTVEEEMIEIGPDTKIIEYPEILSFEWLQAPEIQNLKTDDKNIIYLDADKINFPLRIRKIRQGDSFFPFGMKGSKKLSDFLKDEKIPRPEREKLWLLTDASDRILWIIGMRPDNRFRITGNTRKILKIKRIPK